MILHSNRSESLTVRTRLNQWLSGNPGRILLQAEREQVSCAISNLFGYHILQIGTLGPDDLLGSSRISHRVVLNIDPYSSSADIDRPVCVAGALPVASQSVDVVVLPHVLEFEPDPHQVLREAERILVGEGHIVILGFNPWSLWGLWRMAFAWRNQPPWCGQFLRLAQVKEWLRLLGFEIVTSHCFYLRLPIRSATTMRSLSSLEYPRTYSGAYFGGAYIVVGKKRLVTLTPIKAAWQERRFITSGVVNPTTCGRANG